MIRRCVGAMLALALLGCSPNRDECVRHDQCGSGRCNLLTKECLPPDPPPTLGDDAFAGGFTCPVAVAGAVSLGRSEITGRYDGGSLPLNDGLLCLIRDRRLTITLMGARGTDASPLVETFSLFLDLNRAGLATESRLPLAPGLVLGDDLENGRFSALILLRKPHVAGAMVGETNELITHGVGASGSLQLSGAIEPGAQLSGQLELVMRRLPRLQPGAACTAFEDCDLTHTFFCVPSWGVCTVSCDSDSKCKPHGARCMLFAGEREGYCVRACESQSNCEGPSQCQSLPGGGSACLPPGLTGRDVTVLPSAP